MRFCDLLDIKNIKNFQKEILKWGNKNVRKYPWRSSKNPYYVFLAEKLLQQTKVRPQLVDIYNDVVSRYPSFKELANAYKEILENILKPLGLIYRGKELIKTAIFMLENYHGKIPEELDELLRIPGLGQYISRVILSFCYEKRVAIIDTNIGRFYFRLFGLESKFPSNPARNQELIFLGESLLPSRNIKRFNLSVLDLSALICKSRNPHCKQCPVSAYCKYYNFSQTKLT